MLPWVHMKTQKLHYLKLKTTRTTKKRIPLIVCRSALSSNFWRTRIFSNRFFIYLYRLSIDFNRFFVSSNAINDNRWRINGNQFHPWEILGSQFLSIVPQHGKACLNLVGHQNKIYFPHQSIKGNISLIMLTHIFISSQKQKLILKVDASENLVHISF